MVHNVFSDRMALDTWQQEIAKEKTSCHLIREFQKIRRWAMGLLTFALKVLP
jgi:hypothetical protein